MPKNKTAGDTPAPDLLAAVRSCRLCTDLPLGPRPILQHESRARILVAGQAPGRKAHQSGIPFDDASGDRLRDWMGIDREAFYDPARIAILPMGFCFPGTGSGGDLPPRPECAAAWRTQLLSALPNIQLTLIIGKYALDWHIGGQRSVTERVAGWRALMPSRLPLPHPSPRNNRWLAQNPWFERDVLPRLRRRVTECLNDPA